MIFLNKPTRRLVEKPLPTGKPSIYFDKTLNRWVFDDNGVTPLPFNSTANGNTPVGNLDYIQIAPMLYIAKDDHFLHFKGFYLYHVTGETTRLPLAVLFTSRYEDIKLLDVSQEIAHLDYNRVLFAKGIDISNLPTDNFIDWGHYYINFMPKELNFNVQISMSSTKGSVVPYTWLFINLFPIILGDGNTPITPTDIYLINFNNFSIPLQAVR